MGLPIWCCTNRQSPESWPTLDGMNQSTHVEYAADLHLMDEEIHTWGKHYKCFAKTKRTLRHDPDKRKCEFATSTTSPLTSSAHNSITQKRCKRRTQQQNTWTANKCHNNFKRKSRPIEVLRRIALHKQSTRIGQRQSSNIMISKNCLTLILFSSFKFCC